jgi:hypothetical protein
MLSLFNSTQAISKNSIDTTLELLEVSPAPNSDQFLSNPESERTFYDFFFEVLVENDISCALTLDWKWEPDDLFWQLERHLSKEVISLNNSESISAKLYRIEILIYGKPQTLLISINNPHWLLDELSRQLKNTRFIDVVSPEDHYSWLITPKHLDIDRLRSLTGLTTKKLKTETPKSFAEGYRQSEKLFFSPTIIYVDKSQVGYEMPGQVWAGRILPAQTIKEGIATELKEELNYTGRFSYSYDGFEGLFKDRKGRDIKRYRLTICLFDKTFHSKMAGETDIRLERIPNKDFYHPDTIKS